MASRRIQYNNGPAMVDIVNFVPGNDISFQITISHDISDSTFEAAIHSHREEVMAAFTVSGVVPLSSGIMAISMPAAVSVLVTENGHWFFDEIRGGLRRTLMAGDVEVYLK